MTYMCLDGVDMASKREWRISANVNVLKTLSLQETDIILAISCSVGCKESIDTAQDGVKY